MGKGVEFLQKNVQGFFFLKAHFKNQQARKAVIIRTPVCSNHKPGGGGEGVGGAQLGGDGSDISTQKKII